MEKRGSSSPEGRLMHHNIEATRFCNSWCQPHLCNSSSPVRSECCMKAWSWGNWRHHSCCNRQAIHSCSKCSLENQYNSSIRTHRCHTWAAKWDTEQVQSFNIGNESENAKDLKERQFLTRHTWMLFDVSQHWGNPLW